jgi:hypothetical protein
MQSLYLDNKNVCSGAIELSKSAMLIKTTRSLLFIAAGT